jgi:hypothetical protein
VLVVFIASCAPTPRGSDTFATPSASGAPTEPIDASSRTSCAARVLSLLVDAINARDETVVGSLIGPSPTQAFQWVSMSTSSEAGPTLRGPGVNEVDYSPEGARRILLQHAARGERWSLGIVRAGAGPSWHGGVDAEVHLERTLADGRIVRTGGKTALSCRSSVIYVLSLGDE